MSSLNAEMQTLRRAGRALLPGATDEHDPAAPPIHSAHLLFSLLRDFLLARARPGTRIISHDYFFSDWPPGKMELLRMNRMRMAQIYLWRVGTNVTG